jgi:hypothetical protein
MMKGGPYGGHLHLSRFGNLAKISDHGAKAAFGESSEPGSFVVWPRARGLLKVLLRRRKGDFLRIRATSNEFLGH